MGWDGSETRRKMTEGSDTTRLHRPPGSTCLARVARGGSARGGGLSNGRWTLDVVDETKSACRRRRGAVTMASSMPCGRVVGDGELCRDGWLWPQGVTACRQLGHHGPKQRRRGSSGGGTRLMPVEWYARDRKIRDGVGGTALGRGAAGGVCWKRPGARLGQSTLEHSQRGCG